MDNPVSKYREAYQSWHLSAYSNIRCQFRKKKKGKIIKRYCRYLGPRGGRLPNGTNTYYDLTGHKQPITLDL